MKKNIALLTILMTSVHFSCHTKPFKVLKGEEYAPSLLFSKIMKNKQQLWQNGSKPTFPLRSLQLKLNSPFIKQ